MTSTKLIVMIMVSWPSPCKKFSPFSGRIFGIVIGLNLYNLSIKTVLQENMFLKSIVIVLSYVNGAFFTTFCSSLFKR